MAGNAGQMEGESMNRTGVRLLVGSAILFGLLLVDLWRHRYLTDPVPPLFSTAITGVLLVLGAGLFAWAMHHLGQMNDRLHRQQQQWNAVFDHSSDAILLTDARGRILRANPATERLTGLKEKELLGTHFWHQICRDPEGGPLQPERCPVVEVVRSRRPIPYLEANVAARDGQVLPVTASFSPVPAATGEVAQVAVVLRDLREKRTLEAEIARLLAETERRRRQAVALYEISRDLAVFLDVERDLAGPLERVREMMEAGVAILGVLDPVTRQIHCPALSGFRNPRAVGELRLRLGQGVLGRVISSGRPVQLGGPDGEPMGDPEAYPVLCAEGVAAALAVPVASRGQVIGALLVGYREPHGITGEDRRLLENVARQLGIALENARLYRQVEKVAMLEERDRLAREIHDGLAQSLASLHLRIESLLLRVRSGALPDLVGTLQELKQACAATYSDVRKAIFNLKQHLPPETDLGGYLAEYLHEFARGQPLAVELTLPPQGLPALPPAAEAHLVRIVQEALHNVVKHARARRVSVKLEHRPQELTVTVRDDGVGFTPAAVRGADHYGLTIMAERARQAGGTLALESAPGAGTVVRVTLPLPEQVRAEVPAGRGNDLGRDPYTAGR